VNSSLVEAYVPKLSEAEHRAAVERARASARALSRDGTTISYRTSLFVPEDETCFHVFEGSSPEAVAEATRMAELAYARIVPVTVEQAEEKS